MACAASSAARNRTIWRAFLVGGTTTFAPTHQYHLGLWFNNPKVPFRLGCEKGTSTPVVTPFNGRQHAGIQVLNTAQFPVNKGPLSRVHR